MKPFVGVAIFPEEHDNHDLAKLMEQAAIEILGWKWLSYVGRPVHGPDYPGPLRVRKFFSAEMMAEPTWTEYLTRNQASDADGTEPLAYCYCSSKGYAWPFIDDSIPEIEAADRTPEEKKRPHVASSRLVLVAALQVWRAAKIGKEQAAGS